MNETRELVEAIDTSKPEQEVASLVSQLIQIDSSNFGNNESRGEGAVAEYCQAQLAEVGITSERFTTTTSHREGLVARIPGRNPDRPKLLVHGHIDVVPANEPNWQQDPFGGEIVDGTVWGRGAVDMKDMDGMMLATFRNWARLGIQPDRDIVVLFLPDEEAGGTHGSHWLVENRPDIFVGVTEAIGEVGAFSYSLTDDLRIYPIQIAEKGMAWLRLRANGIAGHGSLIQTDNAVARLCDAAARVGTYRFPVDITPAAAQFIEQVEDLTGVALDLEDPDDVVRKLGSIGRVIGATVRNTANLTMVNAGFKENVVPAEAEAVIDGRFLPGRQDQFIKQVEEIIGDGISWEYIHEDIAVETSFDGPTIDLMASVLRTEDPGAVAIPYLMSGGTDAKAFSSLGIRCFGFSPLRLPSELDFFGMFHAVDEQVPISSLQFGVRTLDRFLRSC